MKRKRKMKKRPKSLNDKPLPHGRPSLPAHTYQRRHGEHLHRKISDGELPVMVVLHVVALHVLIVLQAVVKEAGERRKRQKREERCVGLAVLTTVGAVKSCTDREVTDTTRS